MLPDSEWFPWEEVVEVDLGYGSVCWAWTRPLPPTGTTISVRKNAGDPPNIAQAQAARVGSHHTPESRRKMSETRKARYGKQPH